MTNAHMPDESMALWQAVACAPVRPTPWLALARHLARGVDALRAGRPRLRERMAASPLCDIEGYVAAMQALLQRLWQAHCEGDARRVIGLRT